MFGYVLPDKPELKIREYEVYRAYYCAVCKAIGRQSGQLPRMTLSYDLAFLALLLDALSNTPNRMKLERCVAHVANKHAILEENPIIRYAADMNVLLAYYNARDKWSDDRSLQGAGAALFLAYAAKKAGQRWPRQQACIEKELRNLRKLEEEGCPQMDEAAEPFAKLMEGIFTYPDIAEASVEKALAWLGYHLGRWIYFLDAVDDITEDRKSGNYNPILKQYKDVDKVPLETIEFTLFYTLSEVDKALKVLNIQKNSDLINNIVESGLAQRTTAVLKGRKTGDE